MKKFLFLAALMLAGFSCKQADFAATQRRGSESNLELGKSSAFGGKADASDGGLDTDGYDADGGSDGDSDGGSGGGKDSGDGGRDTDGDSDGDDTNGGKDSDDDDMDGTDDLFIGDDEVDDNDDGDDEIDEDEDEITGEKAILKITGLRRDRNDAPVLIVRRGDKEERVAWPAKGQTIEIKDICDHKEVEIEIETQLRGQTFKPSQTQCFIAKENGDNSWHVGFEHDCNSNDYNKIDDTIATFTCSISDFEIKDIAINNSIPMRGWID